MEQIPFNVDANMARLIGRENVSKLDGAIIELIKNSYDADASYCILYYEDSTKTLWLIDNGSGMNEDIIKKHWMSIGYSDKEVEMKSKSGRIKTGAKGIGRFALDRLGSNCKMFTKTVNDSIIWSVNWEDFVRGKNINQIYATIEHVDFVKNKVFDGIKNVECRDFLYKSFNNGTAFKIKELRDDWDASLIDKLITNLSFLIPPSLYENFKVYFFCEDTKVENGLIRSNLLSTFDYSIEFSVSCDAKANILIQRNEFDFGTKFNQIIEDAGFTKDDVKYFNGEKIKKVVNLADLNIGIKNANEYNLGAFNGRIHFYKILKQDKNEAKFYYKPFETRKNLIKQYGGIKIYRDGFRVRPYGESDTPQFDWLLLSVRHYKSAFAVSSKGAWKADASQLIGEINISRLNDKLNDQANREGIFEDKYFEQFKDIITKIISYMEEDRQYVARKLNQLWEKENQAKVIENKINEQYNQYVQNKEDNKTSTEKNVSVEYVHISDAKKVIQGKDSELQELEDENRILRSLATTGIAINTYMHETKTLIHNLKMNAKEAIEDYKLRNDIEGSMESIKKIRETTRYFDAWFQVTIESMKADKRKRQRVNICNLISSCVESWKSCLGKDINFKLQCPDEDILFNCFPYEIESIMHNLISNSYKSFKRVSTEEKIVEIIVKEEDGKIQLLYNDNGAGLVTKFKKNPDYILKQMVTTDEENGTGMGLWIVNSIVTDYGGHIDLSKNIDSKSGFYIDILL